MKIRVKDIYLKTMTEEKKKYAKNDIFAYYITRPISYVLTIPCLKRNIKPITITNFSLIFPILGFLLFLFGNSKIMYFCGWLMFFIWNILDAVDGNISRYTETTSKMGSVTDASVGYVAMALTFLSAGISNNNSLNSYSLMFRDDLPVILGALSGIMVILQRLIMHKKLSTLSESDSKFSTKNVAASSLPKIFIFNVVSVVGGAQLLFLLAIIFGYLDLFTVIYFFINLIVFCISVYEILYE